jgi:hypothetical protein
MNWHWHTAIKSVAATFYRGYFSRDPYELMANVDGQVVQVLGVGRPSGFLRLAYVGRFATRTWIKTYRDDSGELRIGQCSAMARERLMLRLRSLDPQPDDLPDEAFELDGVQRAVGDALEAYLAEHFKGRPLSSLLPDLDIEARIAKQGADAEEWSWLKDVLNRAGDEHEDDDEVDWWKRGETPPY